MQQHQFHLFNLKASSATFYKSYTQLGQFFRENQGAVLMVFALIILTSMGLSPEDAYAGKLAPADGTGSKVTTETVSILKKFLTWVVYIIAAILFLLVVLLMMKAYKDWVGKKEDLSHVMAVVLVGIIITVVALIFLNQSLGYLDELK